MDTGTLIIQLLLSFLFGAVIGLEREVNEKKIVRAGKSTTLVGIRSFALVSILGTLVGFLYTQYLFFALLLSSVFFILLIVLYVLDTHQTNDAGITSELALLFSFVIGFLLTIKLIPIQIVIALTVVIILLLSQKQGIKNAVTNINKLELSAFISYLIIAFVILPFLPNKYFSLHDFPSVIAFLKDLNYVNDKLVTIELFNPFRLWFIVALVTGVDLLGYILEKFIGQKRGWLLTSAIGGFISSTATTESLSKESKKTPAVHHFVGAAILANVVSFIQIALLIAPINGVYLAYLFPTILLMVLTGLICIFFLFRFKEKNIDHLTNQKSDSPIIDIGFAIKFSLIYISIGILAKIGLLFFGDNGLFVITAIGSLIGLDAVILNIAQLAGNGISFQTAGYAFIIANIINLVAKTIYSIIGGAKEFAKLFFLSILCIIAASFIGIFFFAAK